MCKRGLIFTVSKKPSTSQKRWVIDPVQKQMGSARKGCQISLASRSKPMRQSDFFEVLYSNMATLETHKDSIDRISTQIKLWVHLEIWEESGYPKSSSSFVSISQTTFFFNTFMSNKYDATRAKFVTVGRKERCDT